MSGGNPSNPSDELDGLQTAVAAAVNGAITRSVTVRNRDVDGTWPGPWPLIVLRLRDFTITRIGGGQTGVKGQQGREVNHYAIEIQDRIDPRDTGTERVAASQSDLYALMGAIVAYFDHLPNQGLPLGGIPTAYKAGEDFRFVLLRPFQQKEGTDIRMVLGGTISVLGIPHEVSET